ncbi:Arrestin domain-containing protein 3 [Pseudolycoriella hygida]|uniref:Arrestin domain-containing protein 3 n=1 Tax=Pseudolycoriella hygida TaxID=35572 RepID=A0A9Q0MUD4_9DIPT|nr:Arrestin domain-containing protein 3 [Pseudolycoriella hygida]
MLPYVPSIEDGKLKGEVVVQPGEYIYTFSCALPVDLPTSVEGDTGHIRYCVIVNLDRPMWPDQEFEECFTVLKPVNLNDNIALRYPLVKEARKTFFICCLLCCCETSPVFITARIPVSGYTPGQTIELSININNKSDQKFEEFVVLIVKHIQYHTYANSSRTTFDTIELEEQRCLGCNTNQSQSRTVNITVPPVPPTDESTSNIVKVSYLLRIKGCADCCREDPVLDLPITIGTYPILLSNVLGQTTTITQQPTSLAPYSSNGYAAPNTHPSAVPTDSFQTIPSAPTFSSDEGIDPPTYEEATSKAQSGDINGKVFKPSYPVYRRTPSYSTDTIN